MQYFYANEQNQKSGPFSVEELKSHGIKAHTLVWCQGMDDWKPANQVAELKELFPTTPNMPPPVPAEQADPFAAGNAGYGPGGGYQNQGYQGGGYPAGGPNLYNLYEPTFDVNALSAADRQRFSQHTFQTPFSVGVGILLHFLTFGLFTFIRCGLEFDKLPKIKHDDASSGKAIGFMFIPFFNLYWLFIFWGQLTKRINFQYKLRGMSPPISTGMATGHCIVRVIPYVNFFSFLITLPILYSQVQAAVNTLAEENQQAYMGGNKTF